MDIVKVKRSFFELCREYNADPHNQLLQNKKGRPCVIIVKLEYRGRKQDFVVPLKSNIPGRESRENYYPLPPTSRTRPGNRHGIFYIKLFPVLREFISPYLYEGNHYLAIVKGIIDRNQATIIRACQAYLKQCEAGRRQPYTPDIDLILRMLDERRKG